MQSELLGAFELDDNAVLHNHCHGTEAQAAQSIANTSSLAAHP